jgi:hypothetical protein
VSISFAKEHPSAYLTNSLCAFLTQNTKLSGLEIKLAFLHCSSAGAHFTEENVRPVMVQWHHGQRGGPQVSAAARKRPAQSILGAEEKVPESSRSTFRLVKFKIQTISTLLIFAVVRGGHRQVAECARQPSDASVLRGEPNPVPGAGGLQDQGRAGGAAGGGRYAAARHPAGGGPQVRRPHHRHPLVSHGGRHRGGQSAADRHPAAHHQRCRPRRHPL